MDILIILLLALLAIFLVLVETLLLPGVTVAAIGALGASLYAAYYTNSIYGLTCGVVVFLVILALSIAVGLFCIRKRSLARISLNESSDSSIPSVRGLVAIGDLGLAVTRLAPIGTIIVGGNTVEAKSLGGFLDQRSEIRVVGFEDNIVLVEKK